MTPASSKPPQAEPAPAPELHAELPLDLSAFISSAVVMAPGYVESPAAAEQLPFLFWLCEAVRPRTIVDLGAVDAAAYFGLCQAADTLSLNARCYLGGLSLDLEDEQGIARVQHWIEHQNTHHGARSQIIGGGPENAAEILTGKDLDLLVLHAEAASPEQLKSWATEFLPKCSPHCVVFIDGLGDGHHEFYEELAAMGPGLRFQHGTGFGVVAPGSSPPELMRYLDAQANQMPNAEVLRSLFQRLGLGCRNTADLRSIEHLRGQLKSVTQEISAAREDQGLKAARLVAREAEIFELRDRLDWHHEQLEEAQRKLAGSQVETHRLRAASERLQSEAEEAKRTSTQSQQAKDQLQAALEETRRVLDAKESEIGALRESSGHTQRQLRQARAALIKSMDAERRLQINLAASKSKVQNERQNVRGLRNKARKLREELDLVYSSRSWKVTAPLRRLITQLRD